MEKNIGPNLEQLKLKDNVYTLIEKVKMPEDLTREDVNKIIKQCLAEKITDEKAIEKITAAYKESKEKRIEEDLDIVNFPETLTRMDKNLIVWQCVIQDSTRPNEIENFASVKKADLDKRIDDKNILNKVIEDYKKSREINE